MVNQNFHILNSPINNEDIVYSAIFKFEYNKCIQSAFNIIDKFKDHAIRCISILTKN